MSLLPLVAVFVALGITIQAERWKPQSSNYYNQDHGGYNNQHYPWGYDGQTPHMRPKESRQRPIHVKNVRTHSGRSSAGDGFEDPDNQVASVPGPLPRRVAIIPDDLLPGPSSMIIPSRPMSDPGPLPRRVPTTPGDLPPGPSPMIIPSDNRVASVHLPLPRRVPTTPGDWIPGPSPMIMPSRPMSRLAKIVCGKFMKGVVFGKKCLSFSKDYLTWDDAIRVCNRKPGKLASLTTNDLAKDVLNHIKDNEGISRFWIGGSDIGVEGEWRWLTGDQIDENIGWAPNQPDNNNKIGWNIRGESCLEVNFKGAYNDAHCNRRKQYICDLDGLLNAESHHLHQDLGNSLS